MKRPAFQFYPADWRKDVELRSCSMAARGLWIDLLCVMHECEPYGHLIINGKPVKATGIVNHIGGNETQIKKLLQELTDNGVARLTAEGAIYSKRMVEDEGLRIRRANGGSEGAEHGVKGAEHGRKGGRPRKDQGGKENPPSDATETAAETEQRGDLKPPLKPPPSSSSSSSPSGINTSGTTYPHPPAVRLNGSHSAGLPGIEARKPAPERLPDCPHSVIVGLYAKHLPQLRQPKVWTGARAEAMRARWRQGAMPSAFGSGYIDIDGGTRFWDKFFAFVATCPKLVNGIPRPDQSRWEPDLPWLMKAENFAKVIEGNYAP